MALADYLLRGVPKVMSHAAILPVRQQAQIVNEILGKRFDRLLLYAMQATDFDAWVIICHEDHYDPVFRTMVPWQTWAPILQMLFFFDNGRELERLISRGRRCMA